MTLTGRRFSWAAIVRFGGVKADFAITSDEQIAAVVPEAAVSGPVTVLSPGGTATSSADFVVLRPVAPTLTLRATPATFALGRRVRLAGLLTPADSADSPVTIVVQRRLAGAWKAAASSSRSPDASGAYAWSYRPRHAGTYRARASFPAAAASDRRGPPSAFARRNLPGRRADGRSGAQSAPRYASRTCGLRSSTEASSVRVTRPVSST